MLFRFSCNFLNSKLLGKLKSEHSAQNEVLIQSNQYNCYNYQNTC
jgi:hypothetical protein